MREDYRYRRRGAPAIFRFFDPDRGWRRAACRDSRTAVDWAEPVRIPFSAKMTVKRDEEFREMFEQSWRALAENFYDPDNPPVPGAKATSCWSCRNDIVLPFRMLRNWWRRIRGLYADLWTGR